MKRFVAIFLAMVMTVGLSACGAATKGVKIDLGKSERFSEAERQAAADFVLAQFQGEGYEGCTLRRIYYDEAQSLRLAPSYIDGPQYDIYGMDPDDIIVLFSDFRTGDVLGSFEPNANYNGWAWYLIRDGKGEPWREYTHGYA
jgi:hypothetical protein